MNHKLTTLINGFSEKLGLEKYTVGSHSFHKEQQYDGEIHYTCNVEFFPPGVTAINSDDIYPPGTMTLEYNLTKDEWMYISFVGQESFSTKVHFPTQTVTEVAEWIEQETGYLFGKDFNVTETLDNGYQFTSEINGCLVFPTGLIEVQFTPEGKLTSFMMFDMPPDEASLKKEEFTLTLEQAREVIERQTSLIQLANEADKKFISAFAFDEIFVMNDGLNTIPYDLEAQQEVKLDRLIEWETPLDETVELKFVEPSSHVTLEEAFSSEKQVHHLSLSAEEIEKITETVRDVLRSVSKENSGKWRLTSVQNEENFVFLKAICEWQGAHPPFFNRTFTVLLDAKTFEVINYLDNRELYEVFDAYTAGEDAVITKEGAIEKLYPTLTISPSYMYDLSTNTFRLCGLIRTNACVDAVTGELITLYEE